MYLSYSYGFTLRLLLLSSLFAVAACRLQGTRKWHIGATQPADRSKNVTLQEATSKTVNKTSSHGANGTQAPHFLHEVAYTPPGPPLGSLIFIGPYTSYSGFCDQWLAKDMDLIDPTVKQHYRIIEAIGTHFDDNATGKPYVAWWRYQNWEKEIPVKEDVDAAVDFIHQLIYHEWHIVGYLNRVILVGYSQGANLALEASVRYPSPLGLVVSQRGVLLEPTFEARTQLDKKAFFPHTPTILTGGDADDIYSMSWVKKCCRFLQKHQVPVFLKSLPGVGHHGKDPIETWLTVKSSTIPLTQAPPGSVHAITAMTDWTTCEEP